MVKDQALNFKAICIDDLFSQKPSEARKNGLIRRLCSWSQLGLLYKGYSVLNPQTFEKISEDIVNLGKDDFICVYLYPNRASQVKQCVPDISFLECMVSDKRLALSETMKAYGNQLVAIYDFVQKNPSLNIFAYDCDPDSEGQRLLWRYVGSRRPVSELKEVQC